jgi:cell wall-associated NlpC family hydrolase
VKHLRFGRVGMAAARIVAIAGLLLAGLVATAGAEASASPLSTERAKAAVIASQLDANAQRIAVLGQRYDAAQATLESLQQKLAREEAKVRSASASLASSRSALRSIALWAFVNDMPATKLQLLLDADSQDLSVREGFLSVASGEEQQAIARYASAEQTLSARRQAVSATLRAQAAALATLRSSQARAEALQAHDAAILHGLDAKIAALVKAEQLAQERAAAKLEAEQIAARQRAAEQQAAEQQAAEQQAAEQRAAQQQAAQQQASGSSSGSAPPETAAPPSPAPSPVSESLSATQLGARAVAIAEQQLGKPYVWAAAGPNSFDCSGLVQYVYAQLGISLAHYTVSQWDETAHVPLADAQPGNLVFYQDPGTGFIYHVGIYIGHGEMIDAPETGENVQIDTIYWPNLMSEVGVVQ